MTNCLIKQRQEVTEEVQRSSYVVVFVLSVIALCTNLYLIKFGFEIVSSLFKFILLLSSIYFVNKSRGKESGIYRKSTTYFLCFLIVTSLGSLISYLNSYNFFILKYIEHILFIQVSYYSTKLNSITFTSWKSDILNFLGFTSIMILLEYAKISGFPLFILITDIIILLRITTAHFFSKRYVVLSVQLTWIGHIILTLFHFGYFSTLRQIDLLASFSNYSLQALLVLQALLYFYAALSRHWLEDTDDRITSGKVNLY